MAGPARYSEPGPELQRESPGSTQISFAPNPFARLFARLINAVIWVGAGLLLLLANLVIIGGIAISETWPLLNDLLIADVPNTDRLIVEVLAESFADYRVRDVALIALIPIATIPLWFILRMAYLCLLVRFAGGDLGHLVMGMRVVSYRHGCRPSFGQALSRAILRQLDLLVMPFLLNCALVSSTGTGGILMILPPIPLWYQPGGHCCPSWNPNLRCR